MTTKDQIRTALSNVGRRKLRSALASLGVVVGTLTIVIMVSLASGVRQQINRQFASIGLDRLILFQKVDVEVDALCRGHWLYQRRGIAKSVVHRH